MFWWMVHSYSSASRCSSCCWTVPPLRLLTDWGSFLPDTMTAAGICALHPRQMEVTDRQHPYLLPSPPLLLWLHEQAVSFSPSAIPACSSPLSGPKVRICIQHSRVEEIGCQACSACAAFHTYPSPRGFTYQSCKPDQKKTTVSSALPPWHRAPSMKWSKQLLFITK